MKLKRLLKGSERGADVRMVQRALNAAPSRTVIAVTSVYDETTQRRVTRFRAANSLNPSKQFDQEALDELWPYFDAYGRWRYRLYQPPQPKPVVPQLGPVYTGGKSVLLHDLTHETDGLPGYPAFDDGWVAGRSVIAPEDMIITRLGSAQGGSSIYATGASTMRWWFGHVFTTQRLGVRIRKGETFAHISGAEKPPHVHVGIDAKPLIGHELLHHTDYTHGAPTVGVQLAKALDY